MARRVSRRPILFWIRKHGSEDRPPQCDKTVTPMGAGESLKVSVSAMLGASDDSMSNPKSSPPRAAPHVLFKR